MPDADLAKYGAAGVAIAALIAIVYVVKYVLDKMNEADKRHLEATERLRETLEKNTLVTSEMYAFLRNLNGKFKSAVKDKLNEK